MLTLNSTKIVNLLKTLILYASLLTVSRAGAALLDIKHLLDTLNPHLNLVPSSTYCAARQCVLGKFDGLNFHIPQPYIKSAIQFEGETRWRGSYEAAYPDAKLVYFGIFLRKDTLAPVLSSADLDYATGDIHRVPYTPNSIEFTFDARMKNEESVPLDSRMVSVWGPYAQKRNEFGLTVFDSIQGDVERNARGGGKMSFYFSADRRTKIWCVSYEAKNPSLNSFVRCTQDYSIRKIHSYVSSTYNGSDLPRWKEFNERVDQLLNDFVSN